MNTTQPTQEECCEDMDIDWDSKIERNQRGEPIVKGECLSCGAELTETWTENRIEVSQGGERAK